jgi:peptidoglycan/xylan/chitin deacetylase (PgdA/CDA1 family)
VIRRPAKFAAEALLGGSLASPIIRLRGRSLVLAYHNVVASRAEAGSDASLHVDLDLFREHLDALLRTHQVVPLDDLLENHTDQERRAALTFDDACRGAVRYAVPELARRGLPATLFVVPGHLGRAFWWDRVRGPMDEVHAFRDHVLEELDGDGDAALEAAPGWGLDVVDAPSTAHPADEEELRRALEHPGIQLGSHSWNHRNLAALRGEALEEELRRPIEWLESRFETSRLSRWIAFPYGLYDRDVEEAAAAAGYRGGLRIDGGCLGATGRLRGVSVPRVNVPAGLSARGLRLRIAGLLTG